MQQGFIVLALGEFALLLQAAIDRNREARLNLSDRLVRDRLEDALQLRLHLRVGPRTGVITLRGRHFGAPASKSRIGVEHLREFARMLPPHDAHHFGGRGALVERTQMLVKFDRHRRVGVATSKAGSQQSQNRQSGRHEQVDMAFA